MWFLICQFCELKQRYEIVNGIVEAEGVKSKNASEQEGQEKGVYLATDFLILSLIGSTLVFIVDLELGNLK